MAELLMVGHRGAGGRWRLGQLGLGRWGQTLLRAFADTDGADVVVGYDPDPDCAVALPRTEHEEALWARDDLDAVVIASPPARHYAQARAALLHGKHVFVEKPLALLASEAASLVELANQRGCVLMVGHVLLYDDAADHVRRWLESGRLGRVRSAAFRRWGRRGGARDVDALWNLAPHDLSLADAWFGRGTVQQARAWSSDEGAPCDESWLSLRYGDVEVEIHVGHGRAPAPRGAPRRAVLEGTRATAVLEGDRVSLHRVTSPSGAVVEAHRRRADPLRREVADFVACLATGQPPRADGPSAQRVVEILARATAARRHLVRAG